VQLVDLDGDARLELVGCDMRHGMVFLGRPYDLGIGLTLSRSSPVPRAATWPISMATASRISSSPISASSSRATTTRAR
jgi:hypothetical protein